jgi:hypothetical protein
LSVIAEGRVFTGPATRPSHIAAGVFACALAALLAVYVFLARTPAVGMFHDDGVYLVTAKSLAEGHGYRIISLPDEPPQTKYPIVFPALVSVMWRLYPSFPANLFWLRLVPLTATLLWLWLAWPLLRRLGASRHEAGAVVLLTAASPWVAFLSTTLLSETVFAAVLTAALLLITRMHQEGGRSSEALFCGVLAGAAVLTRIAGVAPAAAGVAWLAFNKRWRASLYCLAGTTMVTLPWVLWTAYQQSSVTALDGYYTASNYGSWNVIANYAWREKLGVLGANLVLGGLAIPQIWTVVLSYSPILPALAITSLAVVALGLWRMRREPVPWLVLAYCAIHLVWVWPPLRFVVPVAPLLLWFAYVGTGRPRRVGCLVALALLGTGGFRLAQIATQAYDKGINSPMARADNWNELAHLLEWTARETPSGAVLTGNLDPTYYLITGRKAVRAFSANPLLLHYNVNGQSGNPLGTLNEFRRRLLTLKADYLILTPTSRFEDSFHLHQLVSELKASAEESLIPVAGSETSGYLVYRIDRSALEEARSE